MPDRILITDIDGYDELSEQAFNRIFSEDPEDYGYDTMDELIENMGDDLQYEFFEEIYAEEVYEVYDAQQLRGYWLENGWTLDRGYGGPDLKDRIAEQTDWETLFELIMYGNRVDETFDAALITPVELNDLVIFNEWQDIDEDEEYDDEDEDAEVVDISRKLKVNY